MFTLYMTALKSTRVKSFFGDIYIGGLVLVQLISSLLPLLVSLGKTRELRIIWLFSKSNHLTGTENFSFLPLMIWSIYCAIGVLTSAITIG
jgi:hypothetical protein